MTGAITYFCDCSSYQGSPDWARVAATCGGGAEKVSEGTGYVNPRWAAAKPAMLQVARHGFVPAAYMFMDAGGSGAAQAQHFAGAAGDLAGFGIVVDVERAPDGSPTRQQAVDAVGQLRKSYPGHPVGGYAPSWYAASWDLTFFDWLWASHYVSGSGDPAMLYARVPAAWWAPYGGRSPLMLQFTSSASIAGIAGPVDCSAFHGTPAQLAGHLLPAPPAPVPPPAGPSSPRVHPGEDKEMLVTFQPGDAPVAIPVWADAAAYGEPPAYGNCSLVFAGGAGAVLQATLYSSSGASPQVVNATLAPGKPFDVIPAGKRWSGVSVVEVRRLDTRKGVPASAAFRTW